MMVQVYQKKSSPEGVPVITIPQYAGDHEERIAKDLLAKLVENNPEAVMVAVRVRVEVELHQLLSDHEADKVAARTDR